VLVNVETLIQLACAATVNLSNVFSKSSAGTHISNINLDTSAILCFTSVQVILAKSRNALLAHCNCSQVNQNLVFSSHIAFATSFVSCGTWLNTLWKSFFNVFANSQVAPVSFIISLLASSIEFMKFLITLIPKANANAEPIFFNAATPVCHKPLNFCCSLLKSLSQVFTKLFSCLFASVVLLCKLFTSNCAFIIACLSFSFFACANLFLASHN
jgi:hypothetical protein